MRAALPLEGWRAGHEEGGAGLPRFSVYPSCLHPAMMINDIETLLLEQNPRSVGR
jgi:hypothetical protein